VLAGCSGTRNPDASKAAKSIGSDAQQFVRQPFGVVRDTVVQPRRKREQANEMSLDDIGQTEEGTVSPQRSVEPDPGWITIFVVLKAFEIADAEKVSHLPHHPQQPQRPPVPMRAKSPGKPLREPAQSPFVLKNPATMRRARSWPSGREPAWQQPSTHLRNSVIYNDSGRPHCAASGK
jgi:hypothetical protein